MAEDIWHRYSSRIKIMENKVEQLIQECRRQSEGCLYTSTSLFIWLRTLRYLKVIFIVAPLVLGSLAGGKLLLSANAESVKAFSAICAFFAGLLPSIYAALKYDDRLKECVSLAAEFKNLQDRFRQAALVASAKPFPEFEAHFNELMSRLELARKSSFTAPEWCFKMAQKKIKGGNYHFDTDIAKGIPQQ
jgi:hypothetical protein